jgi:3-isopropylmalate dehydrogenase
MNAKIAVLPGDYIGPEVTAAAVEVLDCVARRYGHTFHFEYAPAGCTAIEEKGDPIPESTLALCRAADAVLLGAVGGPVSGSKWDELPGHLRPEAGLLRIRAELGLFANLRPARLYPQLREACPLHERVVGDGIDMIVVRELIGGLYFGPRGRKQTPGGEAAYDTMIYSQSEVERIARVGFETARRRRGILTSVDKANVLESSRLWRSVVERMACEYPDVTLNHLYVDNAAMQMALNPGQFDVIVTGNLFGDILSDIAGAIIGSIGMLPSASLSDGTFGLYEPVHGSAPDIAGKDAANPLAMILSAALLLRYSLGLPEEALAVEGAVDAVLREGGRTGDIARPGETVWGTRQMTDAVIARIGQ